MIAPSPKQMVQLNSQFQQPSYYDLSGFNLDQGGDQMDDGNPVGLLDQNCFGGIQNQNLGPRDLH